MKEFVKLSLQFFGGEGGGSGAGASGAAPSGNDGGQASGVDATAAAEQRLREMGVPEAKAKQRASRFASRMPTAEAAKETNVATAAANDSTPTEDKDTNVPTTMNWDEFMAIPENNKRMQTTIQARLKSEKASSQAMREAMEAMNPALELMARKYGLDAKNMDYKALAEAISNDDAYYEQKAMELGTSIETAKRIDQLERDAERRKEQDNIAIEEQNRRNHIMRLAQQSEALKVTFPGFDLRAELANPQFARLVDPKIGMSVEDAYHAVHRKEIQAAQMQYAAQKTAENMSNAIQAGQMRPDEAGSTSQAPSVSTFDYRNATQAQRDALKKQIRAAAARGEKLYPTK
jgi:hypothetical protein